MIAIKGVWGFLVWESTEGVPDGQSSEGWEERITGIKRLRGIRAKRAAGAWWWKALPVGAWSLPSGHWDTKGDIEISRVFGVRDAGDMSYYNRVATRTLRWVQLLEAGTSFPSIRTPPGHCVNVVYSRGSIFAKSIWIRAELLPDIKKNNHKQNKHIITNCSTFIKDLEKYSKNSLEIMEDISEKAMGSWDWKCRRDSSSEECA